MNQLNKLLLCLMLVLMGCQNETNEKEIYFQNLVKYLDKQFPDHDINHEERTQYIVIPSHGCTGCISMARDTYDKELLENTWFITNLRGMHHEGADHLLVDQDPDLLNQVVLGPVAKPMVFQIKNKKLVDCFPVSADFEKRIQEVVDFDSISNL